MEGARRLLIVTPSKVVCIPGMHRLRTQMQISARWVTEASFRTPNSAANYLAMTNPPLGHTLQHLPRLAILH